MTLTQWLKGRKKSDLARAANVSWMTIHRLSRGAPAAGPTAMRVSAATGGAVTVETLLAGFVAPEPDVDGE